MDGVFYNRFDRLKIHYLDKIIFFFVFNSWNGFAKKNLILHSILVDHS